MQPRPDNERDLRDVLLQALYAVRRNQPNIPGLSLIALTELLGYSIEAMQFTLWYLRGKKLIETVEDGNVAITVLGVDHVESEMAQTAAGPKMIALASIPLERCQR